MKRTNLPVPSLTPWLGDAASFAALSSALARLEATSAAELLALRGSMGGSADAGFGFDLQGNVAVIDVKGPLSSTNNPFAWLFGVTTYGSLREQLMTAASDPQVGGIVLNIDSPGGSPSGLPDMVDLVRRLGAAGLPIDVYTPGSMGSAAMWLGAAARARYGSPVSSVGSVGAYMIHVEESRRYDGMGVTQTVFRDAPNKGTGNDAEPLTEDAKAHFDSYIADMGAPFRKDIGRLLKLSGPEAVDGRSYVGQKAVASGFLDGLSTLDKVVAKMQSEINQAVKTGREATPMARSKKKLMTPEAEALMQDGMSEAVALEAAGVDEPEAPAADPVPAATLEAPEAPPAPAAPSADLVAYLQSQINQITLDKNQAEADKAKLMSDFLAKEAKLAALEPVHASFRQVIQDSLVGLQVKLQSPKLDVKAMDDATLLAQHSALLVGFMKFPVGSVTLGPAADNGASPHTHKPAPSFVGQAEIAATSLPHRGTHA